MFGSRVVRSERSFSLCLAEELLRAELRYRFGNHVKIFSCNIKATPATKRNPAGNTVADPEIPYYDHHMERTVTIAAYFGPMERLYPDNPPEDKRCHLYHVKAKCRLFSIESGCTLWRPHFLRLTITDSKNFIERTFTVIYENGCVNGSRLTISNEPPTPPSVINPCLDMVASQPRSNKPQDWTPRIDD